MYSHTIPDGSSIPTSDDVAVLIIGGGPCGLLQAYLLAQLSSSFSDNLEPGSLGD